MLNIYIYIYILKCGMIDHDLPLNYNEEVKKLVLNQLKRWFLVEIYKIYWNIFRH